MIIYYNEFFKPEGFLLMFDDQVAFFLFFFWSSFRGQIYQLLYVCTIFFCSTRFNAVKFEVPVADENSVTKRIGDNSGVT